MILLAGLQGIDRTSTRRRASTVPPRGNRSASITLPLLRPTTMVVIVLSTIAGFQAFDYIYTLTGGGPVGGTTLIVQYIYETSFQSPIQFGLASAAGLIFFVVVFVGDVDQLLGRSTETRRSDGATDRPSTPTSLPSPRSRDRGPRPSGKPPQHRCRGPRRRSSPPARC